MNAKVIGSLRAYHEAHKDVVNKGNAYSVPPQALEEEPGFNPRNYEDPDVVEHIRNFAEAYKRGDFVPPIVVQVVDGKLKVREGHCRRLGLLLAISEGAKIERTAIVENKGDEIAQTFLILTSNQSLSVKTLERAEIYRRLRAWGKTEQEIATGVGKSPTHVAQYLEMIELPLRLKDAIRKDQISPTAALDLYHQQGSEAVSTVNKALKEAAKSGRTRVTTKNLNQSARMSRHVANSLARHVVKLSDLLEVALKESTENELVNLQIPVAEVKAILDLRERLKSKSKDTNNESTESGEESKSEEVV